MRNGDAVREKVQKRDGSNEQMKKSTLPEVRWRIKLWNYCRKHLSQVIHTDI